MLTFWTIIGLVLVGALVFAWWWDRRHSLDRDYGEAGGSDQAHADAYLAQFTARNGPTAP